MFFQGRGNRNSSISSSCCVAQAIGEAEAAQKGWEGWTGLENLEQTASSPSGAPPCCPSLDEPGPANEIIEHDCLPYSDRGQSPSQKHHPQGDLFVNEGGKITAQFCCQTWPWSSGGLHGVNWDQRAQGAALGGSGSCWAGGGGLFWADVALRV